LGHVEEFLAAPGAPNLYWPLTALPRPLFDARRAAGYERGTLYRSFPALRRLREEKLSPEEARRLAHEVLGAAAAADRRQGEWTVQAAVALLAAQDYAEAKRARIARGRPAAEVEAMPVIQVVLLHDLDQYE